jgi:hypothetical protein
MIVDAGFFDQWAHKGHVYGECMSDINSDIMYVHIPKNASSWTKPNLLDWGWDFYNYHNDKLDKTAIVVLRDPVERWISGICECLALYHPSFDLQSRETIELIFDRVCFDDHCERQINFIHGLDINKCIFLWCDQNYRKNFSQLITEYLGVNKYDRYEYQKESKNCPIRSKFKTIFLNELENPKYLGSIKDYFRRDYELIDKITFYDPR